MHVPFRPIHAPRVRGFRPHSGFGASCTHASSPSFPPPRLRDLPGRPFRGHCGAHHRRHRRWRRKLERSRGIPEPPQDPIHRLKPAPWVAANPHREGGIETMGSRMRGISSPHPPMGGWMDGVRSGRTEGSRCGFEKETGTGRLEGRDPDREARTIEKTWNGCAGEEDEQLLLVRGESARWKRAVSGPNAISGRRGRGRDSIRGVHALESGRTDGGGSQSTHVRVGLPVLFPSCIHPSAESFPSMSETSSRSSDPSSFRSFVHVSSRSTFPSQPVRQPRPKGASPPDHRWISMGDPLLLPDQALPFDPFPSFDPVCIPGDRCPSLGSTHPTQGGPPPATRGGSPTRDAAIPRRWRDSHVGGGPRSRVEGSVSTSTVRVHQTLRVSITCTKRRGNVRHGRARAQSQAARWVEKDERE